MNVKYVVNYLILIICVLSVSCASDKLSDDVEKLCSMPIVFDDSIFFMCNKSDNTSSNSLLKCIVYIDSSECAPCRINGLYEWSEYTKFSRSTNGIFEVIFVIVPKAKDYDSIVTLLKTNKYDSKIYIDSKCDFERLNPMLPDNKKLHTFIIDSVGNILMVGSPLGNKKLEKIFYKTILRNCLNLFN